MHIYYIIYTYAYMTIRNLNEYRNSFSEIVYIYVHIHIHYFYMSYTLLLHYFTVYIYIHGITICVSQGCSLTHLILDFTIVFLGINILRLTHQSRPWPQEVLVFCNDAWLTTTSNLR